MFVLPCFCTSPCILGSPSIRERRARGHQSIHLAFRDRLLFTDLFLKREVFQLVSCEYANSSRRTHSQGCREWLRIWRDCEGWHAEMGEGVCRCLHICVLLIFRLPCHLFYHRGGKRKNVCLPFQSPLSCFFGGAVFTVMLNAVGGNGVWLIFKTSPRAYLTICPHTQIHTWRGWCTYTVRFNHFYSCILILNKGCPLIHFLNSPPQSD